MIQNKKTKQVHLLMSEELFENLAGIAINKQTNVSQLIRDVMLDYAKTFSKEMLMTQMLEHFRGQESKYDSICDDDGEIE